MALSVDTSGGAVKKVERTANQPSFWRQFFSSKGTVLALWYGGSFFYGWATNILLMDMLYPWTIATLQNLVGFLIFLTLWYQDIRKAPQLNWQDIKVLLPIAFCHIAIHAAATIATGYQDGLDLAHVIKALEPLVTIGLDWAIRDFLPPIEVFLGIIPLIAGVILPLTKGKRFDGKYAILSLVIIFCSSARAVLVKKILSQKTVGKNLDARNLYAVLSLMSTVVLIPVTLYIDGFGLFEALKEDWIDTTSFYLTIVNSGIAYYLFNEASFVFLDKTMPLTYSLTMILRQPAGVLFMLITYNSKVSIDFAVGIFIALIGYEIYMKEMRDFVSEDDEYIELETKSPIFSPQKVKAPKKKEKRLRFSTPQ